MFYMDRKGQIVNKRKLTWRNTPETRSGKVWSQVAIMVSKSFQWLLGWTWQLPLLVLPPAWFPSVVGYCQEHCAEQDSKADFRDGKTECWDWLLMSAMDMVWRNDDQRATMYLSLLGVTLSAKWSQIMPYRCTYRHCYIDKLLVELGTLQDQGFFTTILW